jgi:hypothetical protein
LQVFLRDATVPFRGGLFSVALSVNESRCHRPKPVSRYSLPWRYQARCPCSR